MIKECEDIPGNLGLLMDPLMHIRLQEEVPHPRKTRLIDGDEIIVVPRDEGIIPPRTTPSSGDNTDADTGGNMLKRNVQVGYGTPQPGQTGNPGHASGQPGTLDRGGDQDDVSEIRYDALGQKLQDDPPPGAVSDEMDLLPGLMDEKGMQDGRRLFNAAPGGR